MIRIGIDLSLNSTGVCILTDHAECHRIQPKGLRGFERVHYILTHLLPLLPRPGFDDYRLAIEGYSFGSRGRAVFDIAECGGIVRWELAQHGYEWQEVPPAALKKWATGRGNADKGAMLACGIRKYGYEGSDHNEADALMLAEWGVKNFSD